MHIMSTNFAKSLVWKHEYDARLWRHKDRTPQTNDHHMPLNETPHENFLRASLLLNTCPEISCGQVVVWTTSSKEEESALWRQCVLVLYGLRVWFKHWKFK